MLFKRRVKESRWAKIRNLIWPRMGWRRVGLYYKNRTVRIPDSEYSIAAGLAFGCAISWTPTFGTHLLQCALFSWLTKANWVAAFLGSALGNPWTTPFMMVISFYVGKALLVATGHGHFVHMDKDVQGTFEVFFAGLVHGHATYASFAKTFWEYIFPALLGGYTMALATFPLFYYPFYGMIKAARLARLARIQHIVHKEMAQATGQDRTSA